MSKSKTFSAMLVINFVQNLFIHGDLIVSLLNAVLLMSLVKLSLSIIKEKPKVLILLFAVLPLFTYKNDIGVLVFLLGVTFALYINTKYSLSKIALSIVSVYLLVASLYAGDVIKFPFLFQPELLISRDNWMNFYIAQMRDESLYLPYRMRLIVFSPSIYLYLLVAKVFQLFTLSNFYNSFLIVNIYPLALGLISNFKKWDKSEKVFWYFALVTSLGLALSRSTDIYKATILLSPLFIYLMVSGFKQVNKIAYCGLFVISLIVAFSP